jgi:uncharacterized membrane protein
MLNGEKTFNGTDESSHGGLSVNVSNTERIISAVAGGLILYHTIKKHKAGSLLLLGGGYLLYRAVTGHCSVYAMREERPQGSKNINIRTSVVVNRPRSEVYSFWRHLENLPLFMKHLESVREIDDRTSSWVAKLPGGLGMLHWNAEIVKDVKDSELSWRSLPDASVENAGKVNFSDTPSRGTRIDVMITYRAPLGMIGEEVSRMMTPATRHSIRKDIVGFKHFMENVSV